MTKFEVYIRVDSAYSSLFLTEQGDEYLSGCCDLGGKENDLFVPVSIFLWRLWRVNNGMGLSFMKNEENK